MYNTELLKETYKRNNETEQSVMCSIIDVYPDLTIIRGKNIPNVNWCAKQMKNMNVLILDAKNNNVTHTGRHRTTEFCFIHCSGKITWIDAKQAKTTTNVTDLHGECYRAGNIDANVLFVVEGKGYSPKVVDNINKFIYEYKIENAKVIPISEIQSLIKTYNCF